MVRLLREALDRCGLKNVTVKAVINDTIATLIAAAYSDDKVTAATIYGTGHNTGCREMYAGESGRPAQLINLESGGFSKLMQTAYDAEVDDRSERPGDTAAGKDGFRTIFGRAVYQCGGGSCPGRAG